LVGRAPPDGVAEPESRTAGGQFSDDRIAESEDLDKVGEAVIKKCFVLLCLVLIEKLGDEEGDSDRCLTVQPAEHPVGVCDSGAQSGEGGFAVSRGLLGQREFPGGSGGRPGARGRGRRRLAR
jgi:hypothetical protein